MSSGFDINSFVDSLEWLEELHDMHDSLYYTNEHFEGEIYEY